MSPSSKIAILGLGNTARRDDGIGIHILTRLKQQLKRRDIVFFEFGIAGLDIINYINEYPKVFLIDAIDADLTPGTLKIFKLNEATYQAKERKLSSHEFTLNDVFNLYQTFQGTSDVRIAGIQGKDTSYGTEMTPELETAQEKITAEITTFIKSWK
ncbi:MAG: hydrogenase maturation protease [Nitrospirota bacterium]